MCDLCDAVNSGEYEEFMGFIFIPKCDACLVPILVLNRHESILSPRLKANFDFIMETVFPDKKPRGIGPRKNFYHWHEHILDKNNNKYDGFH